MKRNYSKVAIKRRWAIVPLYPILWELEQLGVKPPKYGGHVFITEAGRKALAEAKGKKWGII